MEINGTVEGMDDITVENKGKLFIWSHANTDGEPTGVITATNISVKAGGKFEPLTSGDHQMKLKLTRLVVNGNGYLRTNELQVDSVNITVDLSGMIYNIVLLCKDRLVILQKLCFGVCRSQFVGLSIHMIVSL